MSAVAAAVVHVRSRLAADPTIAAAVTGADGEVRIFHGVAPSQAKHPMVLIQTYGDPIDTVYNGTARALTTVAMQVRVVGPAETLGVLLPAANAIDTALDATSGDTAYGRIAMCHRTAECDLSEIDAGKVVRYLGGRYELIVT